MSVYRVGEGSVPLTQRMGGKEEAEAPPCSMGCAENQAAASVQGDKGGCPRGTILFPTTLCRGSALQRSTMDRGRWPAFPWKPVVWGSSGRRGPGSAPPAQACRVRAAWRRSHHSQGVLRLWPAPPGTRCGLSHCLSLVPQPEKRNLDGLMWMVLLEPTEKMRDS